MSQQIRSADRAVQQMLNRAQDLDVTTVWSRNEAMKPGRESANFGAYCDICLMGPCRVDPSNKVTQAGVCGADAHLIVARNFARAVASGAAAGSDRASDAIEALCRFAVSGPEAGYDVADVDKLRALAAEWQVPVENRRAREIARDLAAAMRLQFGLQEGSMIPLLRAPQRQRERWAGMGIAPRGIDREIVDLLHRTDLGGEVDPVALLRAAMRTALAAGWGASMIATDVHDALYGKPQAVRSRAGLGVLKKDAVNILMHGQEPLVAKMILEASREEDLAAEARQAGARTINIAGICCTGEEIFARHGVPVAGSCLDHELILLTGAVDLMVVDAPGILPSLPQLAARQHTQIVTTSSKTHISGAERMVPQPSELQATARAIVRRAIESFSRRDPASVRIPQEEADYVTGFTNDNLPRYLGGRLRAGYQPLIDALASGRIRGIVGIMGCIAPGLVPDVCPSELVCNLLARDVLVVQTGCSAIASAGAGLLNPETALKSAGPGLREVCEAVGIPPVLHLGSCSDHSRLLSICATLISEVGVCSEFSELPLAVAIPGAISERVITAGLCAVASGIYTVLMPSPLGSASRIILQYLEENVERDTGGRFCFAADMAVATQGILSRLDLKRKELKLAPMLYENGVKSDAAGPPRAYTNYEPPAGVQSLGCGQAQEHSQSRPPEA